MHSYCWLSTFNNINERIQRKFLDHYEKNKWECASDSNMNTDEGQIIFNIILSDMY